MNISFKESYFIKKLPNMRGSFGYLATYKSLPKGTVIKVINDISEENIRNKINFISPLSLPPRFPTSLIRYPLFSICLNSDSRYRTKFFCSSFDVICIYNTHALSYY